MEFTRAGNKFAALSSGELNFLSEASGGKVLILMRVSFDLTCPTSVSVFDVHVFFMSNLCAMY